MRWKFTGSFIYAVACLGRTLVLKLRFLTFILIHTFFFFLRERLEDGFKVKRERWKGFNRYVREFHKRKERFHREKIDRIQREKINLLKINDVEGYLRMVKVLYGHKHNLKSLMLNILSVTMVQYDCRMQNLIELTNC